jgi:hypothetical protein
VAMRSFRLAWYSLLYWVSDCLVAAGVDYVDVISGSPDVPIKLSGETVTVFPSSAYSKPYELGGSDLKNVNFIVEAFLLTDGKRDDVADLLFEALAERTIPLYDYNEGFPPPYGTDDVPTEIGKIQTNSVFLQPVQYGEPNDNPLYTHVANLRVNVDILCNTN